MFYLYKWLIIKRGAKIKVLKMDTAGGMDWQAKRLEGKVFTVRFIDSAGQIHLEETGLALIPGVDEYEVVGEILSRKRGSNASISFCNHLVFILRRDLNRQKGMVVKFKFLSFSVL